MGNFKLLMLLNKVNRRSGGSASALDLIETMQEIGIKSSIAVKDYRTLVEIKAREYLRNNNYTGTKLSLRDIYPIQRDYLNTKKDSLFKPLKSRSKLSILASVYSSYKYFKNEFEQILNTTDLIIDARSSSNLFLKKIREKTDSKVMFNHAGSPEAFEKFWLKRNEKNQDISYIQKKYKELCHSYDYILFQSEEHANDCSERADFPIEKCFVVEPSCSESRVLSVENENSPYKKERKAIVYIGSIQPRKAQHLAVETFIKIADRIKDYDLHFVGGGIDSEYGENLKKNVSKSKFNSRIIFHGHRNDHLRFLKNADLLLHTSIAEGISRVLREAMLAKIPIIAFNISGTSSILENGVDALLVEVKNTDQMAKSLTDIIENNSLRNKLVQNAYCKYQKNHSSTVYKEKLKNLVLNIKDD